MRVPPGRYGPGTCPSARHHVRRHSHVAGAHLLDDLARLAQALRVGRISRASASGTSSSGSRRWPCSSRSTPLRDRSRPWIDPPIGALERFVEYGAWDDTAVTAVLTHQVEQAPGRLWHGFHVSAVDDTKVHRNSSGVWGTCTFHEYTARCPNRAPTVRARQLGRLWGAAGEPRPARLVRPAVGAVVLSPVPVAHLSRNTRVPGNLSHQV